MMEVLRNHVSSYDWELLYTPQKFFFKNGVTPFVEIELIGFTTIAYLVVIFSLQRWMKNRPAFGLKGIIGVHNFILCVWSLSMCLGTVFGTVMRAQEHGLHNIFCDTRRGTLHGTTWYWAYIYYLSKYYELLDTVILVLKKKPLSFLHVYHHAVMLFTSWSWFPADWPLTWFAIFCNTLVHVFMYYYYFISTLGGNPWWKKYLTSGQILQFFSVFNVVFAFFYYKAYKQDCTGEWPLIIFSQGVNISFLLLFVNFYIQTYRSNSSSRRRSNNNSSSSISDEAERAKQKEA